jgi:phenylacetate-coenzyme A ligase PaaK-like adenylate-forming protein
LPEGFSFKCNKNCAPALEKTILSKIFTVDESGFEDLALAVFQHQFQHCAIYQNYAQHLNKTPATVHKLSDIPFLPVRFFKTHQVVCGHFEPAVIFESSGTTGTVNSQHRIKDLTIYRQSFFGAFQQFYGKVEDWCILALLPAYLERQNSSLVLMAEELIQQSRHPQSGFYLYDHAALNNCLQVLEAARQPTLLLGVSFALLDFAAAFPQALQHTLVMETGGMKGRKKEMIRAELHEFLQSQLGVSTIHSEYGMTELLSQAYSKGNGIFYCPPWMRVQLRELDDPLSYSANGRGLINVIDLANVHSCSFIATDDIGRLYDNGGFEVQGRMDGSDLRGCSLMAV